MRLPLFQSANDHSSSFLNFRQMLEGRVPDAALEQIARTFSLQQIRLKITRGRATKTGDFRPSQNGNPCAITINENLNPYACLITLIHELAHYQVYKSKMDRMFSVRRTRKNYSPHGKEWKETFRLLFFEYLTEDIFPAPVLNALMIHLENPKASTFSDQQLLRALAVYDAASGLVTVESLPEGSNFRTTTGRHFRKLEKKRTRYLCLCLDNRKRYLFSPIAQVTPEE